MKTTVLTKMALMLALLMVLAFVPPLSIGFLGVPIVLQNLAVMIIVLVLPLREATLTIGLFLALAALGLPILTGGRGGFAIFLGPTAGFMYGWLLSPLGYALMSRLLLSQRWWTDFIRLGIGAVVLTEVLGALWLAATAHVGLGAAFATSLIYIPGDLIKAGVSVFLVQQLVMIRPALRH